MWWSKDRVIGQKIDNDRVRRLLQQQKTIHPPLSSSNKDTMPTEPIPEHLTHPRQSFQTLKPEILILPPENATLLFCRKAKNLRSHRSQPRFGCFELFDQTSCLNLDTLRMQLPHGRQRLQKKMQREEEKERKESEQPSKGGVNDVWVDGRNR